MKYHYKDLELYKQLHQTRSYGDTGSTYANDVSSFIKYTNAKTILDFGSGTGSLKKALSNVYQIEIDEFDPCVLGKNKIPQSQYDLIITTDLLEHLYKEEIDNLFDEMMSLTPQFMYHGISTRPARILLPDGTNCHKTVENANWWIDKIQNITKCTKIQHELVGSDCVIIKVTL